MEFIAKVETPAGGAVGLVFNSVPQNYTDLYMVVHDRHINAVIDGNIFVNGAGGSRRTLYAQPTTSSAVAPAAASNPFMGIFANMGSRTADTFGTSTVYFYDYTAAKTHSALTLNVESNNNYAAFQGLTTNSTSSSAAITSIEIRSSSGNMAEGSYAVLYGILKGSDGTTTVS